MKLLSDQVSEQEITVILRELSKIPQSIPGDVVEFGCYVGTTSVFILDALQGADRRLWLYDSFDGLPEKTDEDISAAGEHFKKGELRASRKQLEQNIRKFDRSSYVIKKAWFSELSKKDIPEHIVLAFLDGDYFESITTPLRLIWDHLVPGGIVIVDDYDNPALPGAAKSVQQWAVSHDISVRQEQGLAILKKSSSQQ